jgi:flagellin-like hook-associated protein FlgL
LSGSITGVVASQPPTELPVASCQLPVSKPTVAGDELFAAVATTRKDPAQAPAFGSVLSARMDRQGPANQNSPLPSGGPGAAPERIPGKQARTAKAKPQEQNGDKLAPVQTLPVAETLLAPPIAATAPGNFFLPKEDLKQVSAACAAASENGVAVAQANTRGASPASQGEAPGLDTTKPVLSAFTEGLALPQQPPAATPSPAVQQFGADQNTQGIDKQSTSTAVRPGNASFPSGGDRSPSFARSFESLVPSVAEPAPGQTFTSATATPESTRLPNPPATGSPEASMSETRAPASEGRSGKDEAAAAAELTTATLPELSDVPGRACEAQLKPAPRATPPLNSAVVRNGDTASKRTSDRPNQSAGKPDASSTKPLQPAGNVPPGEEQSTSTWSDLTAVRAHVVQPAPTIATPDGQDKPGTTTSVVLPEAGRASANTTDVKQQAASVPPSLPAENAPAAPAVIQSARVLERMGQSEMRLGLNSNNFGSIELHTRVDQDRVGASITTSHTDLASTLQSNTSTTDDIANATNEVRVAYDQMNSARTFYGSTVDQLNASQDFLNTEKIQFTQQSSDLVGVDVNQAASDLANAETARNAALQAAASIGNLSLFNYLTSSNGQ